MVSQSVKRRLWSNSKSWRYFQGDGYTIGLKRNEHALSLIKKLGKYQPSQVKTGDFTQAAGCRMMQEMNVLLTAEIDFE